MTDGDVRFEPDGTPRGTVIVLHEIFGLNGHIRSVASDWAARGFVAVAPALFEGSGEIALPDVSPESARRGVAFRDALGWDAPLRRVGRLVEVASGPVFVLGMSFGGTLAWRCAARFPDLAGVVAFSPGNVADFMGEAPRVPVQLHLAARDPKTPASLRAEIARRHPSVEIRVHDAAHAFYRPIGDDWSLDEAGRAEAEVIAFVERRLASVPSVSRAR